MKFNYTDILARDTRGKTIKRPMLELELLNKKGESVLTALALIDSGADTTMINRQYAIPLGIDLTDAPEVDVMGIGDGIVPTQTATLRFRIKQTGDELEIPANYADGKNVDILLGEEVFFDKYKIKFEKDHNTFEIVKTSK